jgi:hypothetical protein
MKRLASAAAVIGVCCTIYLPAFAATEMPERLMCATVEALDCEAGAACFKGRPADLGAPPFMRIDLANKSIAGAKRSTPIVSMQQNAGILLLQGTEAGFGWTLAVDTEQGTMSATLVNGEGAFVLFGSCTPM